MNFLRLLALEERKLDESSRLDVVEIARVHDMLPSLFRSWFGKVINLIVPSEHSERVLSDGQ